MSKTPLSKDKLNKVIHTTQAIEGYKPASNDTVKKVQELKARHDLKVSLRK